MLLSRASRCSQAPVVANTVNDLIAKTFWFLGFLPGVIFTHYPYPAGPGRKWSGHRMDSPLLSARECFSGAISDMPAAANIHDREPLPALPAVSLS
jgi:hypothetical protein